MSCSEYERGHPLHSGFQLLAELPDRFAEVGGILFDDASPGLVHFWLVRWLITHGITPVACGRLQGRAMTCWRRIFSSILVEASSAPEQGEAGRANHTADYVESPGKLPGLVIESVREFAKPEYGVDLLKLESPLAANSLPARVGGAAAKAAQKEFDAIGDICRERNIPWVLLSGGAAPEKFELVLDYSYAAGAGGFLAGRTLWLNALLKNFPDRAAVSASLRKDGLKCSNGSAN
ncbi:hypothetical protein [Bradyrhizobium canariense]|uniref:hypothetical protein n=1 Tax=Bradyrhizobium canariense TaxID=255045 RepID=UPI001F0A6157|nr:hypothetical protein [Bradyrhizobium canariense]